MRRSRMGGLSERLTTNPRATPINQVKYVSHLCCPDPCLSAAGGGAPSLVDGPASALAGGLSAGSGSLADSPCTGVSVLPPPECSERLSSRSSSCSVGSCSPGRSSIRTSQKASCQGCQVL